MALRIGPVGPVREAGLGSGAGLGSEAAGRAPQGAAVRPLSLPCRRCPPTLLKRVCTLLRWRRPIPNAASRRAPHCHYNKLAGAAAVAGAGLAKAVCGWRRRRFGTGAPSSPLPVSVRRPRESRDERGGARRRGSNRRARAAPCWRARRAGGVKTARRACRG